MPGATSAAAPLSTPVAAMVRETHSAVVVLIGDRAYKVKKPVDLGFLDFSTPERREGACRRELALNRRLAPDVYLGVAAVTDPEGRICEHLLVMRRMPEDRRLSRLVQAGCDVSADLRHLARDVAAFHATARTDSVIGESGSPAALAGRWRDNIAALCRLASADDSLQESIARAERLALDYVAGRHRLLTARVADGLVRDGHGDLLADDVFCLPDGPRALDCLDFDDRLRWLDVLDDVACLAMDLERLGAPDAATGFLRDYAEFSGTRHPESLRHHYVAYRAVMRAKVAAVRRGQSTASDDVGAGDEVRGLVELGLRHLRRGQVRLVLVGGGPATGKTTLADAVADRAGFAVLSSDRTRKEMLGLDPREHRPAAYQRGIYRPETTDRTYHTLAERAAHLLAMGESTVVDASFAQERHRALFHDVARDSSSSLVQVECRPPAEVAAARLDRRAVAPDAYSDAGPAVGPQVAAAADPWPGAMEVDTSRSLAHGVAEVLAAVGPTD